jgi:hypothetical protein
MFPSLQVLVVTAASLYGLNVLLTQNGQTGIDAHLANMLFKKPTAPTLVEQVLAGVIAAFLVIALYCSFFVADGVSTAVGEPFRGGKQVAASSGDAATAVTDSKKTTPRARATPRASVHCCLILNLSLSVTPTSTFTTTNNNSNNTTTTTSNYHYYITGSTSTSTACTSITAASTLLVILLLPLPLFSTVVVVSLLFMLPSVQYTCILN